MTLDLLRDLVTRGIPPAPPAAHLFGALPHDAPRGWSPMRRAERDHFPAHFAPNFAAALTEAKVELLAG